jgi:cytochrome c oxidase subunit 2
MYSEHGGDIDQLIDVLHVFMFLLFIPWGIFFLYCLVRFRERAGHRANYALVKAKISKYAEVGVAIIEMVLLLGFSMPVWAAYKDAPPPPEKRLEVRVVAEQFQWDFHYPGKDGVFGRTDNSLITASNVLGLVDSDPHAADDIVLVNEFHLPVDQDVYLRLSSKDVIHSFDIPTLRVKQDVVPGMEIPIWFKVTARATTDRLREEMTQRFPLERLSWYRVRHHVAAEDHKSSAGEVVLARGADLGPDLPAGRETIERLRKAGLAELKLQPRNPLEVVCAQLCGNSHFKMKAQLVTHAAADYATWLETASKKPEFEQEF